MSIPNYRLDTDMRVRLDAGFSAAFGVTPACYFSAPGRTEIGGNQVDHQRGKVLAAAVNLETVAAVRKNGTDIIRILSQGYPRCQIKLTQLQPLEHERNTTAALVRGVTARFAALGCQVEGFDAYCESTVPPGSGLSSSAAFEVLIGTIINHLFFDCRATAPEVAQIGQYAENVFFGKPCGLLDQMTSSVGGLLTIDFENKENPSVRSVNFDFSSCGHALCIIDTRADHADLTDEYAAVPGEMQSVARWFGCDVLTQVDEAEFYASIPALREVCGDRAVMRCIHFYQENSRVEKQVETLERGDFPGFLELIRESGRSSWMYAQNVIPEGSKTHQDVAVALALCEKYLQGKGAHRIHGGGFAGTIQAFVPHDILDSFVAGMDGALGEGACLLPSIRSQGGVKAEV